MDASHLIALIPLVAILASDAWVFLDATKMEARDRPVIARIGDFEVATPRLWLVLVVLVWVFAFPLYLVARKAA